MPIDFVLFFFFFTIELLIPRIQYYKNQYQIVSTKPLSIYTIINQMFCIKIQMYKCVYKQKNYGLWNSSRIEFVTESNVYVYSKNVINKTSASYIKQH